MDVDEIVIHHVQRDRVRMVLALSSTKAGTRNLDKENRAMGMFRAWQGGQCVHKESGRNRMNYELAKELRDAGFPNIQDVQHRQGREFLAPDGRMSVYSLGEMAPTSDWFIPSLEELMEACGDKLMSLHRTVPPRDMGNFWCAEAYFESESDEETPTRGSGSTGIGNTPTEAVVRLWLALNKTS